MTSLRRNSLLGALFAALLTGALAVVLGPASPAQAYVCGPQKTVRTSIVYRACVQSGPTGKVLGRTIIQNNHGSSVKAAWVQQMTPGPRSGRGKLTLAAGQTIVDRTYSCDSGDTIHFATRMNSEDDDINGPWGATSSAPAVICS